VEASFFERICSMSYQFTAPAALDLAELFHRKNDRRKDVDAHKVAATLLEAVYAEHRSSELLETYVTQATMAAALVCRANYSLAGPLTSECLMLAIARGWRATKDEELADAFMDVLEKLPLPDGSQAYNYLVDKGAILWMRIFRTLRDRPSLNEKLQHALLGVLYFEPSAVPVAAAALVGSGVNSSWFVYHPEALALCTRAVQQISSMVELVEKLKLHLPLNHLCTAKVFGLDEVCFTWIGDGSPLGPTRDMLDLAYQEAREWLRDHEQFTHATVRLLLKLSTSSGTAEYSRYIPGRSV